MRHQNQLTRAPGRHRRAYALVSALMAIVLLTVMVVAFISNAGTDRLSANSYKLAFVAEEAIEAGLEAAKVQLLKGTKNDHFIVAKTEDRAAAFASPDLPASSYYYIGYYDTAAAQYKYVPLFSGADTISQALPAAPAPLTPPMPPASPNFVADLEATGSSYPKVEPWMKTSETRWVDVNPDAAKGQPKVRYSYWIEDLGGYLDARAVGNALGEDEDAGTHRRTLTSAYAPDDIGLYTLFKKDAVKDATHLDDRFMALKDVYYSPRSVIELAMRTDLPAPLDAFKEENVKSVEKAVQRNLVAGLVYDNEQEIVPYLPNVTGGVKKLNLNTQVTTGGQEAVDAIVKHIKDRVPTFASRRGAFGYPGIPNTPDADEARNDSYLRNLAANFIDYADKDMNATTGPDFRGNEAVPYLNEFWQQYERQPNSADGYYVNAKITTWVEFWNPSNLEITGYLMLKNSLRAEIIDTVGLENPPDDGAEPTFANYGFKDDELLIDKYMVVKGAEVTSTDSMITIPANGFVVVKFKPVIYQIGNGIHAVPPDPIGNFFNTNYQSNFETYWGSSQAEAKRVDTLRGNAAGQKLGTQNSKFDPGVMYWKGSGMPPINKGNGKDAPFDDPENAGMVGDPRTKIYASERMDSHSYNDKATPGQRNKIKPGAVVEYNREANPRFWPDHGYDTPADMGFPDPRTSAAATNTQVTPFQAFLNTNDPEAAPGYISNTGKYENLAELGNILDPMEWLGLNTNLPYHTDDKGDPVKAGGGTTLRIGSPEFKAFGAPGDVRASATVLDLFTLSDTRSTKGLVNLNTATYDSLRALAVGLLQTDKKASKSTLPNDPANPDTYSMIAPRSGDKAAQADLFAKAVIDSRPFNSLSQLAAMELKPVDPAKAPLKFFGNPDVYTVESEKPVNWDDRGREELFKRVLANSTLHSRNLKVYVSAQVYQDRPSGKVIISRSSKAFQVYIEPTRDSDGTIFANHIRIVSESSL